MQWKIKQTGILAENIACDYLIQSGLKLIQHNFYSRFGEIDLIMRDKDTIVFIEVRQRKLGFDHALESITPAKQKKLVLTAHYYLLKTSYQVNYRFDVIAVDGNNGIKWLKNVIIL